MFIGNIKKIASALGIMYLSCICLCAQGITGELKSTQINNVKLEKVKPENLIHFGDLIDVDVIGSTEYDWRGRLNSEGYLDGLDFIEEPVNGICQSEQSVASEIAKILSRILKDPKVSVKILDRSGRPESYLYGAVKNSQKLSIRREIKLNELLILAGGFTERASGQIQIVRPANLSCRVGLTQDDNFPTKQETNTINIKISNLLKGEEESNPQILTGDIITVFESEPIYIIGGVTNPGKINVRPGITVLRAINSAGGTVKKADLKTVLIYSTTPAGIEIKEINLEEIISGKAEDTVLKKYDIVEVLETGNQKRYTPPVIYFEESSQVKSSEMSLKIIN